MSFDCRSYHNEGACVFCAANNSRAAIRLDVLREVRERLARRVSMDRITEAMVAEEFDRMEAEERAKGGGKP